MFSPLYEETHQKVIEILDDFIDFELLGFEEDWARCPVGALPVLALDEGASTYSNGLLGEDYDRISIRDAWSINKLTGTRAAISLFANNVGFTYSIQEIRSGAPERVTEVIVCVNRTTRNGISFVRFLTQTLLLLLPVTIDISRIDVCPTIDSNVGVISDFRAYEWNHENVMVA